MIRARRAVSPLLEGRPQVRARSIPRQRVDGIEVEP